MCGIFALLNNLHLPKNVILQEFEKGKHRGPEYSIYKNVMIHADFGFHRLAINGLNDESNQPILYKNIALICNGEIYNYKELYREMNVTPTTDSDCEVILHLYMKYGIEHTLQMLDGVFSFLLLDYRYDNVDAKLYVARDPYGVRPLYAIYPCPSDENRRAMIDATGYRIPIDKPIYAFASELKELSELKNELNAKTSLRKHTYDIEQFLPGTYSTFKLDYTVNSQWTETHKNARYHTPGFRTIINPSSSYTDDLNQAIKTIQTYLEEAVNKRCVTTERPVACLLSGGLDSSLITALVNEYIVTHNLPQLETYSIGLEDSEDLKYARIVANYLGTKHTEVILSEKDFLDAIPDVIRDIESYDTTTVRASIGNWLLGKYISEHSEAKVIFNGDGSDELTGGYLYMRYAPDSIEFEKECRRLLSDIYLYDVLRSDKSISSHGLEPRTPFLDRTWVQQYLSLPLRLRYMDNKTIEKYLLRVSFSWLYYKNSKGTALLPDDILWRKKEAFSDGVSKKTRSLYEIIQEFTNQKIDDMTCVNMEEYAGTYSQLCEVIPTMHEVNGYLIPETTEQFYYRYVFETNYRGMGHIVPYFWMPRYVSAKDASARTLEIYGNQDTDSVP
jgi:asparagine synthase (glutamine-hydrolysing)